MSIRFTRHFLSGAVCALALSVMESSTAFAQSSNAGGAATTAQTQSAPPTLSGFIQDTLSQMGLPQNESLAGLSDAAASATLGAVQQLDAATATTTIQMRGVTFDIVRFTPTGSQQPLLVLHAPELRLSNLIPAAAGTPIDALGSLEDVMFVYAGSQPPQTFSAPQVAPADGTALPQVITKLQAFAQSRMPLKSGMNMAATLPLSGISQEISGVLRAVGINPSSRLPLRGGISPAIFKEAFSTAPSLPSRGLQPTAQQKIAIANLLRTYGQDFINNLDLSATVPSTTSIGPFTVSGESFTLKGDGQGGMSFGFAAQELKAFSVDITDALFTYDADTKAIVANGTVNTQTLTDALGFNGLSIDSASLASTYAQNAWAFAVDGQGQINSAALSFAVSAATQPGGSPVISASLDGGQQGISAADIAGRSIPGFNNIKLSKVEVSAERIVADMTFGRNNVPGEIAAFHVGNATAPTLALTVDTVGFGDLVPGAVGSAMDGVTASGLTMMIVPPNAPALAPTDTAIPTHVQANLKKVIDDAAQHDASRASTTFAPGFHVLADLNLQGSQAMGDLMKSAGVSETVIPIIGQVSASTFQANAPKADAIKGLNLSVALPALRIPGLPDTITAASPIFAVTESAPEALTQAAGAELQGPFVSIGLDLQMQAGAGTHDFKALMMVGKNAQGGRVIDLTGSAADPKDLFEFKGLSVTSLDMASVYDAGAWEFKVNGSAALNGAALTFDTDVKRVDGKVEYVATLTGGQGGISAKDVAGRDIPGFDSVALTKVVVTGGRLVADLAYGPKRTPGEIAAFHVGTQASATMAITLDKLAFAELVPGSVGSALDGVEIDGLTLMIVPQGGDGLRPDDPAVPTHIQDNLKKVIADAATHDPTKANTTLGAGFNFLADLDIKGSQGMGDLMKSAGLTETVVPIIGQVSNATFQPNVPKAQSLNGLRLDVALPDLKIPGLPDTITIAKPVFAITDTAPDALTAAASEVAKGDLQAPFVTIGADVQMKAGPGTHDFASVLMVGKDAQGKRVVDLVGSATDPKGLFDFKGLAVNSLDLASIYDAGNWDFKLNGSADLNSAALTFDTEIKRIDNKVTYVATLDGGTTGISAKDVAGRDVPGLDQVALTKVVVTEGRLVADMTFGSKKTPGELAAFHVGNQANATMAFTLDKLAFADLVPGSAGSAMDGVEVDGLSLVVVPSGGSGLKPDDAAIPTHISDNLKKVIADAAKNDPAKATYTLGDGFNLLADLDLKASGGMGDLMASAGVTETVIPVVGQISSATFQPNVPKADSIKGLNLEVALPALKVPGLPDTITITDAVFKVAETAPAALTAAASEVAKGDLQAPFVTIGADLQMKAGPGTHDFASVLMVGKDAQGKRVVDLVGSATDPKGLFQFKGLTVKSLDLASIYDAGSWDFKLNGSADLNSAALTFDTEIKRIDNNVTYVATLDGGTTGISAKDVAGRDVPGLDQVALTKVVVTEDRLVADMTFGPKKTPGELAAFHVGNQANATMAFTLDKLAFSELVPGSAGSALDGVEVDGLSLLIVPQGAAALKPDDAAVPQHIADNLKKVIADAAQHDASKATYALPAGFNLLADLDIKTSGGMGDLMASAGVTETVIPIVGTVSASTFVPNVPKADSVKGINLEVALPDLKVPGLPDTITIAKPIFKITETAPEALTAAASGIAKGDLQAPFVTIGADLQMQAGQGTHDFVSLLMVGKDAQGKRVIDLVGSATDPKGLFEFKGLTVKSLDLASIYDAGSWDFKLNGSADLNSAALTFDTEIQRIDNKVTYVATLDGGQNGISAKDVAGREVPGFDTVALTKVTVTGDRLVADLTFGPRNTVGEIAAFHPAGADHAVMAVTLDKLGFADVLPSAAGGTLDGVEIDNLAMVIVPQKNAGLKPDDASIPDHIRQNIGKVLTDAAKHDASKQDHAMKAGFNLFADLDLKASGGMGDLMKSAGVTETVIPIVGTISRSTFNPKAPKKDALAGLDLNVALPDLKVPGLPDTMTISNPMFSITENAPEALTAAATTLASAAPQAPFISIGAGLRMQAGQGEHDFDALLMVAKDAQGKRLIDLLGSAKDPKGLFEFKGLSVTTLDLASVYDAGAWDFKLDGTADLNGASVNFDTEVRKVGGQTTYTATLSATNGISAKDVAGREVPGFDSLALTKVTVTGDSLTADMTFGPKKTAAEVAAFHPQGADKAVMGITFDKLGFAELVPGASGSPLNAVDVADLTMVVVPEKSAGLKHDDAAIPTAIRANLTKVLTDAGKATGYALKKDINFFADLELGQSQGMQDLMEFIGKDGKKPLPIVGVMSPQLFNSKAPSAQRLAGMDLAVPMPNLNLSGLPSAFQLKNTEFKITDTTPGGQQALWVGLQADMDADLLGSNIAFKTDVGFAKGEISLSATSEQELKKPFGIQWLDLKQLALALDYDKQKKSGELKFTAIPAQPFGKTTPKIEIDLVETGGKLSAGLLKIQEKVAFSDLPILNKVKHADKFDFTFLEIATSGVSGGSELHGEKVDVAVFEHNAKWTFAVSDNGGGKGFKFDRIMPALSKTPLKDFHLNDAALIFSETDINGKVSDLPGVAQTVFSEIYGSTSAAVIVKNGITVAANFSPGASSGFAAKGLQGVGIHDDILIEGSVVNIFGEGAPGVDILVETPQGPGGGKGASHTPKMAKFPGQVGFFVQYQADELDVGLEADIVLHLPKKQQLDLVTKLELELNDKGFAVDIFMDLKGQWKDPFGINGIELDEVALKFGIDMEDEAIFGFKAKTILADGAEKIDIAAEMDFELDAAGLPDGVAMKGSISELGIPAIIDVAERLAGGKSSIVPVSHLPLPEFKDVTFAFATPGVSDPQLGLIGSGFALGGELFFLNRELGKVDLSAGTSGIKMDAAIDPIDFKVLKLDKNTFKMDLGFKGAPKLNIDSEIEFLGAKQTVLVAFDDGMLDMTFEEKIGGGIWDSKITLGMGIDAAHHGEPDIFVQGIIKEDFFKWLRDQAPAQVHKFFNQLNADFEKAKAKIDSAEQKVHGLDNKIAARKAVVQREKANADAAVQRAENRVRSVQNDANNMRNKARYHGHRCKWYRAWECAESGYYWTRYGVEEAAYHVALGVLQAAKATVDHLPSELMDPQLTGLEIERDTALGALELAKLAIDGVEDADKWVDKGLESLLRDIGKTNALVIKEIFFEADLDGMIKGQPAILTMDLEIFGADLGTQMFAFKITDPLFDAEQLLFIPLHMVSELFEKYVPKSLKKIVGPVITSINRASSNAEAKVYQELKNVPGLNLPPDIKAALDQLASLETGPKDWDYASLHRNDQPMTLRRSHRHGPRIDVAANDNQAGWIQLAQATAPANDNTPATTTASGVPLKPDSEANHVQRLEDFKKKKQDLMLHIVNRNKAFGEKLMQFEQQQEADRKKRENDEYVPYTDIKVPPGVLFTEKLLVARHSKLCLGQNAANKTTFHPCSENPGGLLWSTRQRLVDTSGKLVPYNEAFATKWPGRVYTQMLHNGLCLTTPFHLAAYDQKSREAHNAQLQAVASKHPSDQDAHLSLAACRNDGRGQLWKVVKDTHDQDGVHGFKLQERDSAYCLRPGQVAAHTKKTTKEVNGVFFPCSGVAHGTFELTTPNADMPVWYDHNGVIKSDNGYCLDVANDPSAAADSRGSIVFLKACDNDEYDRWDYVVEYDKTVKIVNDFTGYCLYPYDKAEGAIPSAEQNQLVQRPCDGRYGQNWKMRIIPQQKWFQLEALNSNKQGTNTCMVADQRHPGQTQVNVFMRQCNPATRGRWEFGHWKGTYQWAEWTIQNAQSGGSENLSEVFWVSADDLKVKDMIGVCRVIIGDQNTGNHSIYAGTWRGTQCGYVRNNQIQNLDPSQPDGGDIVVEVLTGLDIGVQGATGSWRSSASGVPVDSQGQNKQPPAPTFSSFLVGGDQTHTATYLCRVKQQDKWHYGYQASGLNCQTDAGPNITNDMQVLVFATVKNQDTSN